MLATLVDVHNVICCIVSINSRDVVNDKKGALDTTLDGTLQVL